MIPALFSFKKKVDYEDSRNVGYRRVDFGCWFRCWTMVHELTLAEFARSEDRGDLQAYQRDAARPSSVRKEDGAIID